MVGRDASIAVYIITNQPRGTLYIGVTSQFIVRIGQHRDGAFEGFSKRYGLKRLVWYERHSSMTAAIQREKSLKRWRREWKVNLIEQDNPNWDDLYRQIMEWTPAPPQV